MGWVLGIAAVWVVAAVVVALLLGRGIRVADRKEKDARTAGAMSDANFVVDDLVPPERRRTAGPSARPAVGRHVLHRDRERSSGHG